MPYPDDETLRIGAIDLLGSVWAGLPRAIERARRWGANWFEHSQPFVQVDHDAVVAHVGVIDIPVVLDGNERSIAGVHTVCTRAQLRGRGYFRRVMARALAGSTARSSQRRSRLQSERSRSTRRAISPS